MYEYVGDPKLGKALKKVGFDTMGQAKRAARIAKSQGRLRKLPPKARKKLFDPRRKDLLLDKQKVAEGDEFDPAMLNELTDMNAALLAGTLRPRDAIRRVKAMPDGDDWDWKEVVLSTAKMLLVWETLARRRPKGLHLRTKSGGQVFITKSAKKGEAPSNRPWQLSHGQDVPTYRSGNWSRRQPTGKKQFAMFGHDYHPSIRSAFIDAWDRFGLLKVVDVAESLEEAAGWSGITEDIASSARTSFDSAPYANMKLLDVARLLDGATSQGTLNIGLIEKLVDRLIHALEFTIYSVQGRPEGKRVGDMIRGAFNNLKHRLPQLESAERARATSTIATLSESLEDLEFGPAAPPVR